MLRSNHSRATAWLSQHTHTHTLSPSTAKSPVKIPQLLKYKTTCSRRNRCLRCIKKSIALPGKQPQEYECKSKLVNVDMIEGDKPMPWCPELLYLVPTVTSHPLVLWLINLDLLSFRQNTHLSKCQSPIPSYEVTPGRLTHRQRVCDSEDSEYP